MSDTEQLFAVAGVWSLIAAFVAYFIPRWPAKIVVFALLVGIPFWELPYGYYNFSSLCAKEAHVRVFDPIAPQRSVCVDYPFDDAAKDLLKAGFESVEARGKSGEVRRYVAANAADRREGRQDRITTEYCFASVVNNQLPWRLLRHDHLVKRSADGRVVARQSRFTWSGMWWQEAASPMLGRGGQCSEATVEIFKAVRLGTTGRGG